MSAWFRKRVIFANPENFCIFCNSAEVIEHRNFSSAGRPEPHPFMDVRKITTAAFSAYIKYSLHLQTRLKMIRHQSLHNSNAFVQDDILSESINSIKPMVMTSLLDLLHIHSSIAHSNIRSKIGAHKNACFQRKAYLVLQPIMEPQLPCKKIENRKIAAKRHRFSWLL